MTIFQNLTKRSMTPRWPLTHFCGGHMCDSTQGSFYPSHMKICQSMSCIWTQWPFFLQKFEPKVIDPKSVEVTFVTLPKGSSCPSPMTIHQSMWIQLPFFSKIWTKGHWPLDDLLTPHLLRSHVWLCPRITLYPSPMGKHQCMWIQWSILQNTKYYILHTYYGQNEWSHSLFLN